MLSNEDSSDDRTSRRRPSLKTPQSWSHLLFLCLFGILLLLSPVDGKQLNRSSIAELIDDSMPTQQAANKSRNIDKTAASDELADYVEREVEVSSIQDRLGILKRYDRPEVHTMVKISQHARGQYREHQEDQTCPNTEKEDSKKKKKEKKKHKKTKQQEVHEFLEWERNQFMESLNEALKQPSTSNKAIPDEPIFPELHKLREPLKCEQTGVDDWMKMAANEDDDRFMDVITDVYFKQIMAANGLYQEVVLNEWHPVTRRSKIRRDLPPPSPTDEAQPQPHEKDLLPSLLTVS